MGLSTETNRNNFTGASTTGTFTYSFRILEAEDLLVTVVNTTTDVETTLTLNTHYTVDASTVGQNTGTITLIYNASFAWVNSSGYLITGYDMAIRRVRDITQEFDFRNQGSFFPETHEDAFDHVVMICQQLQDQVDRCPKVPETDDGGAVTTFPSADERASKFMAFDADGEPMASAGGLDATISAFGQTLVDDANASAALTTLGFSTYGKTLIDDADAATARTTLGATGSSGTWDSAQLADGAAKGAKAARSVTAEKTSNYTITTSDDFVRGNPDSAAFTLTLHAASSVSGKRVQIVHSGVAYSNVLTIGRTGSDTFGSNALTSIAITRPGSKVTLVSDGASNWMIEDFFVPQSHDNFILNGDMEHWQAGTSFTSVSASRYAADQWAYLLASSSAVVSLLRSTDIPTVAQSGYQSAYSLHVDNTTADASIAAGDLTAVLQPINGKDAAFLFGKTVTLQFWVKATVTGTYCISVRNSGVDRSYVAEYTVSTTATWEKKSITLTLNPSAGTQTFTRSTAGWWVGFTIAGGSTYQTTANAWQTGNFHCTSNQANGSSSTANDFRLSQVQLVIGHEAYSFRRYGKTEIDEIHALQSYYQKSYDLTVAPGTATAVGATALRVSGGLRTTMRFSCPMIRDNPTVATYSSNSGTVDKVFDIDGSADVTTSYADQGESGFTAIATVTDQHNVEWQWVANAQITPA